MSETTNPIRDEIAKAISEHEVILFMKGRPEQPMCGFSARTVAALDALGASYAAVDILPDPRIRQELSAISNWPTIPQLFVKGELVGGCDIVSEMYESRRARRHARHRAARRRARGGTGRHRAGRPAPPDPERPRLESSSLLAAAALSVAAGDGNEQPARRDRAAAARHRGRHRRGRALRPHPRRHRLLRGRHRGRPHPRLQRHRPAPLRERLQGDAAGRRAARAPPTAPSPRTRPAC